MREFFLQTPRTAKFYKLRRDMGECAFRVHLDHVLNFNSATDLNGYSGKSPYGHLTGKKTSQLQSPWLSPKLYSTVEMTPCNKGTSPLRSLLPSPVGDLNSAVPLYYNVEFVYRCH